MIWHALQNRGEVKYTVKYARFSLFIKIHSIHSYQTTFILSWVTKSSHIMLNTRLIRGGITKQTSPPFVEEAAMSVMQHPKTKISLNTLAIPLKHHWNNLETLFKLPFEHISSTLETPLRFEWYLKHKLNILFFKLPWNILKHPFPWNVLWKTIKVRLKHSLIFLKKMSWNLLITSLKHP